MAVGIGFLAEMTQAYTGSSFDIEDASRDAAGALLYVLARLTWTWGTTSGSGAIRILARALAAAFAIASAVPLAYWSSIFLAERWKAPVVADFDGRWSDYFFYGINAEVRLVPEADINPLDPSVALDKNIFWIIHHDFCNRRLLQQWLQRSQPNNTIDY